MMFWLITAGIAIEATVVTVLLAALWAGSRADRLSAQDALEFPVDTLSQQLPHLPEVA